MPFRRRGAPGVSLRSLELSSVLAHSAAATHPPWTRRERLSWTVGTAVTMDEALNMKEADLTLQWLAPRGVGSAHFIASGTSIVSLKSRGCLSAQALFELGYDALDLVAYPSILEGAVVAYGVDAIVERFCRTPDDVVMLAGTHAQDMLGLSAQALLDRIEGCPEAAMTVLRQLGPLGLRGVQARTLIVAGLNAERLAACGHGFVSVTQCVLGKPADVMLLGFEALKI